MGTKTIFKILRFMKTSNAIQKANATIQAVNAKAKESNLSGFDIQKRANAHLKIEKRSLSRVYKDLLNDYNSALDSKKRTSYESDLITLVGSEFPTFAKFKNAYKGKTFCVWFGLSALRKLNPSFARAEKVKRQNANQAKKAKGLK